MENYKHIAFNLKTGEIIECPRGNALKRAVKRSTEWDLKHYGKAYAKWIFAHNYKVPSERKY